MPRKPPALFLIAFFILACPRLCLCAVDGGGPSAAQKGTLDLSGWDPARDGPVRVDSAWEFYWDRLLNPEDFELPAPPQPDGFLTFPGFWTGYPLDGRPLPDAGCATFRLRLLPGPGERRLELRLFSIPAAFRLWADGRLIARAGTVSATAENEVPARLLTFAPFSSDGKAVELTLQISNHAFRRGGVHYPIEIAEEGWFEGERMRIWSWAMLFSGAMLSMAIYHLILFFLRKNDVSALYVAMYCLALVGMYAAMDSSQWLVSFFWPDAGSMWINAASLTLYVASNAILYRLYRSLFRDVFPRWVQTFCDLKAAVYAAIALFGPYTLVYAIFPWFALMSITVTWYILVLLTICVRRGREGAGIFFFGALLLVLTAMYEIYHHVFGTSPDTIFPLALFAFILSQAFALARSSSNAFKTVETLSRTTDAQNVALRQEMRERERLEREIVGVSEEERRRISHDLHDGLCQRLGGIRLRCGVLELSPIDDPDVAARISEIATLLEESLGQAYDLSRGLWPVERAGLGAGPPLKELAERMSAGSGVAVAYEERLACPVCGNEHLVQLYRIAQEAVTNAVKHANPCQVVISLSCGGDGRLTLEVRDDGTGRAADAAPDHGKGGLGVHIMRYRARVIGGAFSMTDAENGGTVVACSLDCARANPA